MVLPESGVRRWEGVPRRTTAAEPESSLAPTFHNKEPVIGMVKRTIKWEQIHARKLLKKAESIMSWQYQIRKRGDGKGFDMVESYPSLKVWTKLGIAPHSDTKQGLILCLSRMLNDALRYPVIVEKEKRHGK